MSRNILLSSLLIVALTVLRQGYANADDMDTRIVGGYTTTISTVPYLVQLIKSGSFICGGSLVTSRFVVTAQHCVEDTKAAALTVKGGATKLSDSGVTRSVNLIIKHGKYNTNTLDYDVAVLRLESALTGNNIATISLRTTAIPDGATVKISGWGYTSEDGSVSNQVRSVEVSKIAKSSCQNDYGNSYPLTDRMVCASEPGTKDACSGDSGGPMEYNNKLAGIVSWGIGCARENYPGVLTDVSKVYLFIRNAISNFS